MVVESIIEQQNRLTVVSYTHRNLSNEVVRSNWPSAEYKMNRQFAGCWTKACVTVMNNGVNTEMLCSNFVDTATTT